MRYPDCQMEDSDCPACSLTSHGRDCHNNPINEIAYIRHRAGLTQQAMSDLLEIPKRTIENWEANKSKPTDYLVKLIEYYLENHTKGLSK